MPGHSHIYAPINHVCVFPWGNRLADVALLRAPRSTAEGWCGQDLRCRLRAGV